MRNPRTNGVLLVLALCACKGAPDRGAAPDSAAMISSRPAAQAKPALTAMPMLPKIRAQLDSIGADPSMMHRSMAGHEAEVRELVDAMHADMAAAGMQSDAAYEALADSVVKGSSALSTASGREFDRLVMQHVDQLRRLTATYETKAAAM